MLSRTAGELFWLGRYMERADNVARWVHAGQRLRMISQASARARGNEWAAVLIAAGCRETFPGDIERVVSQEAIGHLVLDPDNPSSIFTSLKHARHNARSQRGAISTDTWIAASDAWRFAQSLTPGSCASAKLSETLEQVRRITAQFRGAISTTMLRDERLRFLHLGRSIERADATARLLDVKYHVLLPEDSPVGSALDHLQWHSLLHAAGARAAYRWVYHQAVDYRLVIDFLLLNTKTPRSVKFAMLDIQKDLSVLRDEGSACEASLAQTAELLQELKRMDDLQIIRAGLHEYLTSLIIRSNRLATQIACDFGFGPSIPQAQFSQSQ